MSIEESNPTPSIYPIINSEAVEKDPLNRMDRIRESISTKEIATKVCIDVILLGCVALPLPITSLIFSDYHRGFFCDDQSLMHPLCESTVTYAMLYSVGFLLPFFVIVITEWLRQKHNLDDGDDIKLFGCDIPYWMQQLYKFYGIFLFGASCVKLTTDIAKYSIGRFRPHFISFCQPIIQPGNTTCSDSFHRHRYIENFLCGNADVTPSRLKEMRMSFPSGHSSFSMYTMVFAALYLHYRMDWHGSKLLKHVLQFTFIMIAWHTALSRISDYQSHWSDVLAGSTLGLVVCLLVVFGVSDFFKSHKNTKRAKLPISQQELN